MEEEKVEDDSFLDQLDPPYNIKIARTGNS